MQAKHSYIYFPLNLVSYLHSAPKKAIRAMVSYGIVQYSKYHLAKAQETDPDRVLINAYNHVVYAFYNNKLPFEIAGWIDDLITSGEFEPNEDLRPFSVTGSFDPEQERGSICVAWEDDPEKQSACLDFYFQSLAMKDWGLKIHINELRKQSELVSQKVREFEAVYGKDALVSLKTDMILDFFVNPKSSEDYELLAAYCGVKSIIGSKAYVGTNKKFIVARMVGAKDETTLKAMLADPHRNEALSEVYRMFCHRHHADILIDKLIQRGFLSSKIGLQGTRRLYISCTLDFNDLAIAISKLSVMDRSRKMIKEKEKEAVELLKKLIRERLENRKNR